MDLIDYITDQCDAVREKDGTTALIPYPELASRIRAIPSGGGGGSGWQPHPDWWDIKTMVDTGVLEWGGEHIDNVRYGYVVSDGYPTTKLAAGYEYYLSDGSYYNGAATHTWDRSQDKPCSDGYMTRAVIVVKAANRNVAITQYVITSSGIASLFVYLGDCNVTSLSFNSSSNTTALNKSIQGVLCGENTTANTNLSLTYTIYGSYVFKSIKIPQGMTSVHLSYCHELSSIDLPQSVTSVQLTKCYSLTSIDLPQSVTSVTLTENYYLTSIDLPQSVTSVNLSSCYALASIKPPQGITSMHLNSCYSLTSVDIPQGITAVQLTNCWSLAALSAPVGFGLSINLSASLLLSPASLEQLITNAADMTGQATITFTLGAENLAKLSEEYIQLAAAKNITLA